MRKLSLAFLLFSFSALNIFAAFDKDICISSASCIDDVWTISIADKAKNTNYNFEVGKTKKRGEIELLSFNSQNCTAQINTPRGLLNIALSSGNSVQECLSEKAQQDEVAEILAAANGKVTMRHKASLWKRAK